MKCRLLWLHLPYFLQIIRSKPRKINNIWRQPGVEINPCRLVKLTYSWFFSEGTNVSVASFIAWYLHVNAIGLNWMFGIVKIFLSLATSDVLNGIPSCSLSRQSYYRDSTFALEILTRSRIILTGHFHDDVIKWKHFPRYWSFVRGIHRSQRPVTQSFDVFFDLHLNKRLSNQSKRRWFETPSHPLWPHCNAMTIIQWLYDLRRHGPLTRYVKLPVAHAPGMLSPPPTSKETAS